MSARASFIAGLKAARKKRGFSRSFSRKRRHTYKSRGFKHRRMSHLRKKRKFPTVRARMQTTSFPKHRADIVHMKMKTLGKGYFPFDTKTGVDPSSGNVGFLYINMNSITTTTSSDLACLAAGSNATGSFSYVIPSPQGKDELYTTYRLSQVRGARFHIRFTIPEETGTLMLSPINVVGLPVSNTVLNQIIALGAAMPYDRACQMPNAKQMQLWRVADALPSVDAQHSMTLFSSPSKLNPIPGYYHSTDTYQVDGTTTVDRPSFIWIFSSTRTLPTNFAFQWEIWCTWSVSFWDRYLLSLTGPKPEDTMYPSQGPELPHEDDEKSFDELPEYAAGMSLSSPAHVPSESKEEKKVIPLTHAPTVVLEPLVAAPRPRGTPTMFPSQTPSGGATMGAEALGARPVPKLPGILSPARK